MFLESNRFLGVAFLGSLALAATTVLSGCYSGGSTPEDETGTDGNGTAPTAGDPSGGSDPSDSGDSGDPTGEDPEDPPEPSQAPSSHARVKFKGAERLARDLASGLSLDREELCQELGSYDCFGVHNIALGGVDPYDAAVYEPIASFGVASPIAADRIALTACGERAEIDFDQPSIAVIFADLAGGGNVDAEDLSAAARNLYVRILRREPENRELDEMVAFYDELPDGSDRTQTWAHLSCFAVATSLESLFY